LITWNRAAGQRERDYRPPATELRSERRLTQITSKVNKVRNQLPADAQDPVINVQMAERRTAAMYIMSRAMRSIPTRSPDYLYRVVQPKFNAVSGVQSAQIVGGAHALPCASG